jgi:hypothetical protein
MLQAQSAPLDLEIRIISVPTTNRRFDCCGSVTRLQWQRVLMESLKL